MTKYILVSIDHVNQNILIIGYIERETRDEALKEAKIRDETGYFNAFALDKKGIEECSDWFLRNGIPKKDIMYIFRGFLKQIKENINENN